MLIFTYFFAFAVFMLLFLSANAANHRRRLRQAIGGSNETLQRAVRAQGNFCEYVPFFLGAMAIGVVYRMPPELLLFFGGSFFLGRVMHAYSLLVREPRDGKYDCRIGGMIITLGYLLLMTLAVLAMALYYSIAY